ncbi:hypothetical protein FRX31_035546, partial [Thalictrum thalictroides]
NSYKLIILKVRFWILKLCQIYQPKRRSSNSFNDASRHLGIDPKNPTLKPPIIVFWTKPPIGFVSLCADGAAKDEEASSGGVIRDSAGKHISNFFSFYGKGSNNMAETRAVLDGLILCNMLRYSNIVLQVDSKLALDWFNNSIQIPWTLSVWWRHIHLLASKLNITATFTITGRQMQ